MVDNVSQATLKVNVEGEAKVVALNKALDDLGNTSKKVDKTSVRDVSAIGAGAVERAATREARQRAERVTAAMVPGRFAALQAAKRAQREVAPTVAAAVANAGKDASAATTEAAAKVAPAIKASLGTSLRGVLSSIGGSIASGLRSAGAAARGFGASFASTLASGLKTGLVATARVTFQTIGTVARGATAATMGVFRFGAGLVRLTGIFAIITGGLAGLVSAGAIAAAGIKSLTFSMKAAAEEAEDAFKTFSRSRRLRTDWGNAENLDAVSKILFRDASSSVEDGINRLLEKVRLGKSEEGDKLVYSRLGLTAKTIARFEKELGARDGGKGPRNPTAVDFAERFVQRLEANQKRIDGMKPGRARDAATARQRQFFLDLEKAFGDDFADAVARSSSELIKKAFQSQDSAGTVGPEADSKTRLRQAQDLILANEALGRTMGELKSRIAVDVQPSVTRLINSFQQIAFAIGPNLADKVSELAKRGLGSLADQLDKLDVKQVESWGVALFDAAGKAGAALPSLVDSLNTFVESIKTIADAIRAVAKFLGGGDKTSDGKTVPSVTENPYGWFRQTMQKGLDESAQSRAKPAGTIPALDISPEEIATRIRESSQSIVDAAANAKKRIEEVSLIEQARAAGAAMGAAAAAALQSVTIPPPSWLGQLRVAMPGGGVGPQRVTAFPPSTGRDSPSTP